MGIEERNMGRYKEGFGMLGSVHSNKCVSETDSDSRECVEAALG